DSSNFQYATSVGCGRTRNGYGTQSDANPASSIDRTSSNCSRSSLGVTVNVPDAPAATFTVVGVPPLTLNSNARTSLAPFGAAVNDPGTPAPPFHVPVSLCLYSGDDTVGSTGAVVSTVKW